MPNIADLEGRWLQYYVNEDCVDFPIEDVGVGTVTEIRGETFSVFSVDGVLVLRGTFRLNSKANPPTIDWTDSIGDDKGKTFLAIYNLDHDEFAFSASDEGMARPLSLEPQQGHTIRKFRRESEL